MYGWVSRKNALEAPAGPVQPQPKRHGSAPEDLRRFLRVESVPGRQKQRLLIEVWKAAQRL